MWPFLRKQFLYFLVGFIITFIVYLFVQFNSDDVVLGVGIGVIGGLVLMVVLFLLERQFPDQSPPSS